MINISILSKRVQLKWYENGELRSRIVSKRMIKGDKYHKGGQEKVDVYTGNGYNIVTIPARYKLPQIPIPYPIYGYYDYSMATKLLHFKDINPEIPRAVFYDIETTSLNPKDGVITSICWIDSFTGEEFYTLNDGKSFGEKECLEGFIEYLDENNILSLIGFNSNNFDMPYIEHRCLSNGIEFSGDDYINQDVMQIANKLFYFGGLDTIAQILGIERKLEVDNPVTLWKEGRYKELLDYNIQDVKITRQIYEKLDMAEFLKALWYMTWLDWDKVHSNSHIVNCFYNKRMWEDGYCVSKADLEYKGEFGGGYNFDAHGLYENVYVYDFASLYPNIIRGLHLSPENYTLNDIIYSSDINRNLILKKESFLGVKEGLLDKYITELLELRKKYKAEGKDHEQNACKILVNSVYGILSQKTAKFILGGTQLGATVTWVGRNMLQTVSKLIAKEGIITVYGKTDSIFVQSPYDVETTSKIIQDCVNSAWKSITGTENTTLTMDFEGLYEKLFIVNKNNYAFIKGGKIYKKGGSFHNKKNSQFERDVTDRILEMILNEGYVYKGEIREGLKPFILDKIAKKPISYFAIKHKARKKLINIWDTGIKFMEQEGLGEPEYGFYYYVCKVVIMPPNPPHEVIMFPLHYEPKNGFVIQRKWLESQVNKIMIKLGIKDKKRQLSLANFI